MNLVIERVVSSLLIISVLFLSLNSSIAPPSKPLNDMSLHSNDSSFFGALEEEKIKITDIEQFSNTVSWENTQLILYESMTLNESSHLVINNSSIELAPKNSSYHIVLTIESDSRLEIYDSTLFLNTTTGGLGSMSFNGGILIVVNSTFIGLGTRRGYHGFDLRNSQVTIKNSTFRSGFSGLTLENANNAEISTCSFNNLTDEDSYGIQGKYSNNISIVDCTFNKIGQNGLILDECNNVSIKNSQFDQISEAAVDIYPDQCYCEVENVWIEGNTFENSDEGIRIEGNNITIVNNSFLSLTLGSYVGGRNIMMENNKFSGLTWGITTPSFLNDPSGPYLIFSSISNTTIQYNEFVNIRETCIWIVNYDFPTVFSIKNNRFSNFGIGLSFTGNLGGESSSNRSWVVSNIFNNSSDSAISGESFDNLAHFQFTSFIRNAFINCFEYTTFQTTYYFLDDIRWDDGFFGNYWDESSTTDEDFNHIGDSFYVVSMEYAQVDNAPLMSLDFLEKEVNIGSTHPTDLVRTKAELKVNNTLSWTILADDNTDISVWLNNDVVTYEESSSNVTVSLSALKVGLHNFTLVIQVDNQIYRDLVWVQVFADESDFFTGFVIPVGIIVIIGTIGAIVIIGIRKR